MKNKQLGTLIGASVGILILILDGKTALIGAQEGIGLCLQTVIPALFPFFVLSIMLTSTLMGIRIPLLGPLGKLFSLPQGTESLLIPAFLGGYPAGAQSIGRAYRSGQLSKDAAERMLAFCNNAGPAFLFGMAAVMFPHKWMAWALWAIHIFSALWVSILFPCRQKDCVISSRKSVTLSDAMRSSLFVMAQVCGWVVLFRVVIGFLNRWILWLLPAEAQVAVMGFLELSNGCCSLSIVENIPLRFVICSGMLAFGGLCVAMQTASVTDNLSLTYFFLGKGLQSMLSILLSAAVVWNPWLFLPSTGLFILTIPRKLRKNSRNPAPLGV